MRPFGVLLEGSWPQKWSDLAGFFTTRVVLAEGPEQAGEIARRKLVQELPTELPGSPTPSIAIDDVWEAEAEQLLEKQAGFTFFEQRD